MLTIPSLRPESRYGMPTCDQYLFNREYVVGYSYLFRQPRWALQRIDEETQYEKEDFDRLDSFREDLRIPDMFRSTLADYKGSGFDRGHLINSKDRKSKKILNSETFLLSNMSPQVPAFNRGIWLKLENAVRKLAEKEEYVEVYTICGPVFQVGDAIQVIGPPERPVVIPDLYFKSVLAERAKSGSTSQLKMWTFVIKNEGSNKPLSDFLVPTRDVERVTGLLLWDRILGAQGEQLKSRKGRMWSLS